MQKIVAAAFLCGLLPLSTPTQAVTASYCNFAPTPRANVAWAPTDGEWVEAENLANAMSISELAGASLVVSYTGNAVDLTAAEKSENLRRLGAKQLSTAFLENNFAGAILFSANANTGKSAAAENDAFDFQTPWQFTSVDQEGGTVVRLRGDIAPPLSAAVIARNKKPELAKLNAFHSGNQLRAAGIDVVFAPVADVRTADTESSLAVRTYGSTPSMVSKMTVAQIRGYAQSGVMPGVKHFPGLGGVSTDTHVAVSAYKGGLSELCVIHVKPFQAAIAAGAPMVMVGHSTYKPFGPNPASANPEIVSGLLRSELGFDGIIITDSMTMAAAQANLGAGKNLFVRSLRAGVDLLLMAGNPIQAKAAIGKALANGNLDVTERRESIKRVIAYRLAFERIVGTLPKFPAGSTKLKKTALEFQARVK